MHRTIRPLLPKIYGAGYNILSVVSPKFAAELAFHTFCKVRKGGVLPHQVGYLKEARFEKVEMAGHSVQTYRWEGAGDSVLLVHGWQSNTFRWRNLIATLRNAGFNILAFDAPAHGLSSGKYLHVPLYSDCLMHVISAYKPKYVVGHSVGGMTALYTQFRAPSNGVEKIVTIGSPAEFQEIMTHFYTLLGLNKRLRTALEEYIEKRFGFQVQEFSSVAFVRNIRQKGLLLHDQADTVAPFQASEQVHAHWADSQLMATEGLGHSMHQEVVNKKILEFLIA